MISSKVRIKRARFPQVSYCLDTSKLSSVWQKSDSMFNVSHLIFTQQYWPETVAMLENPAIRTVMGKLYPHWSMSKPHWTDYGSTGLWSQLSEGWEGSAQGLSGLHSKVLSQSKQDKKRDTLRGSMNTPKGHCPLRVLFLSFLTPFVCGLGFGT